MHKLVIAGAIVAGLVVLDRMNGGGATLPAPNPQSGPPAKPGGCGCGSRATGGVYSGTSAAFPSWPRS